MQWRSALKVVPSEPLELQVEIRDCISSREGQSSFRWLGDFSRHRWEINFLSAMLSNWEYTCTQYIHNDIQETGSNPGLPSVYGKILTGCSWLQHTMVVVHKTLQLVFNGIICFLLHFLGSCNHIIHTMVIGYSKLRNPQIRVFCILFLIEGVVCLDCFLMLYLVSKSEVEPLLEDDGENWEAFDL